MATSTDERSTDQEKNRYLASVLALFLGIFGAHKFYVGQTKKGIVFLLFFWTTIPFYIGIISGIHYLLMTDEEFHRRVSGDSEVPAADDLVTEEATDSLGRMEKEREARKTSLAALFGVPKAALYLIGGVLLYVGTVAGAMFLFHGSVDEIVRALEPAGPTDDFSGSVVGAVALAVVIAVTVVRTSIDSARTTLTLGGIARSFLWLLVVVYFLLIPFMLPGFTLVSVASLVYPIPDETFAAVSYLTGGGLATAWLVARTHHTFPDTFYLARRESIRATEMATASLDDAETLIADEEFDRAMDLVDDALNRLHEADGSLADVGVRDSPMNEIEYVRERVRGILARVASEGLRVGTTQFEEGSYETAFNSLSAARTALHRLESNQPGRGRADLKAQIQSLLEEARSELESTAEDLGTEVKRHLEEAESACENGEYDRALTALDSAAELVEQRQRLRKKGAAGTLSTSMKKEIRSLRKRIEREREEAELRSEIDRHTGSIAASFDIDRCRVDMNLRGNWDLHSTANDYDLIRRTLDTVDTLRRRFPEYPWEAVRTELERIVTGEERPTRDTLEECHTVVTSVEEILTYLQTAPQSHPSIDGNGWREAVTVAIEETHPGILAPIVGQIERLGNELWQREHLYEVTWEEFEHLVGELYRDLGYEVEVTQGTADLGIDVWAERGGKRTAIQVKQFSEGNTVGREVLQKLLSTVARGEADNAVVVTSGEFARTAENYAADTPDLQLIDGEELLELLSESQVPPPV